MPATSVFNALQIQIALMLNVIPPRMFAFSVLLAQIALEPTKSASLTDACNAIQQLLHQHAHRHKFVEQPQSNVLQLAQRTVIALPQQSFVSPPSASVAKLIQTVAISTFATKLIAEDQNAQISLPLAIARMQEHAYLLMEYAESKGQRMKPVQP